MVDRAAMLGAVVTRSGAATSVHAFGEATRVGYGLSALAAVIVAVVLGILGGAVPAWRASRLSPIEALRRQ